MRPSFILPRAWGRMGKVGYRRRSEPPLEPIGGDIHLIPDVDGVDGWAATYQSTSRFLFIRAVSTNATAGAPDLAATINGVPMQSLVQSRISGLGQINAYIFYTDAAPLGQVDVGLTSSLDSGVGIVRVGELRNVDALGIASAYGSSGTSRGNSSRVNGTTPGEDWAYVGGVSHRFVGAPLRPLTLESFYKENPVEIHPVTAVAEVTATDGSRKTVALFAAGKTQTLPYPQPGSWNEATDLMMQWNYGGASYVGANVEVKGSRP